MSKVAAGPVPVILWTPSAVQGFDPATQTTVRAASVGEVLRLMGSPREVGVAIGRRHCVTKLIRVPDVPKEDALPAIRLQLSQHVPFPDTEACFDILPLPSTNGDGRKALLAAMRHPHLAKVHEALAEAGCRARWVVPVAAGSAYLAKEALVLQEEPDGLGCDVVADGQLAYSRVAPAPGDPAEAIEEAHRTMAAAQRTPAEIVLAGGLSLPGVGREVRESGLSALAGQSVDLNLELPEQVERRRKSAFVSRRRFSVLLWGAAVMAVMLVYMDRDDAARSIASGQSSWQRQMSRLESTRNLTTSRLKAAEAQSESVSKTLTPAQPSADVVSAVVDAVPEAAWLTGLTLERGRPIQIRGTALTNEAVAAYVAELTTSDRFRDVKLIFANNAKIEETAVVQFSITAHVVGNYPVPEPVKGARRT